MYRRKVERDRTQGWRDSFHVCALSEEDRHLGHIVRTRRGWNAFDSTHLNDARDGFRDLGTFFSLLGAKHAVELATGYRGAREKVLAAVSGPGWGFSLRGPRRGAPGYDPAPSAAWETTRAIP